MFAKFFKLISYGLSSGVFGSYVLGNYQIYHGLQSAGYRVTPAMSLTNYAQQVNQQTNKAITLDLIPVVEPNLLARYRIPEVSYQISPDAWKLRLVDRTTPSHKPKWYVEYVHDLTKIINVFR